MDVRILLGLLVATALAPAPASAAGCTAWDDRAGEGRLPYDAALDIRSVALRSSGDAAPRTGSAPAASERAAAG